MIPVMRAIGMVAHSLCRKDASLFYTARGARVEGREADLAELAQRFAVDDRDKQHEYDQANNVWCEVHRLLC